MHDCTFFFVGPASSVPRKGEAACDGSKTREALWGVEEWRFLGQHHPGQGLGASLSRENESSSLGGLYVFCGASFRSVVCIFAVLLSKTTRCRGEAVPVFTGVLGGPGPKPTQTNPSQPKPTQTNPNQPKPTQTNPSQPKPTQTNPSQPKPTQANPIHRRSILLNICIAFFCLAIVPS